MTVLADFSRDGLAFRYPADWRLELEEADDGWTVTLQSPGTAFAVVRLDRNLPDPRDVVHATLETLRADYPELEAEAAIDMLAGEMAVGHDIEFFPLDAPTRCWTRSFHGEAGTVLVLCQVSTLDPEEHEGRLQAFCASLRAEPE